MELLILLVGGGFLYLVVRVLMKAFNGPQDETWEERTSRELAEREWELKLNEIEARELERQREAEFERGVAEELGERNLAMICPHCQTKGKIRTKPVNQKKGISGGKATAAVLTGGLSVVVTGLSRSETLTQAHCEECQNTWVF